MITASIDAIANGLSATMILVTGVIITIRLLLAIRHSESKLLPWQAIFALVLGSFYTGTVVSFWLLIFTNNNIEPRSLAAILCYSLAPIGVAAAMYIGFSMIKPSFAKPMAWIFGLTAIPFWANLWFNWPEPGSSFVLERPAVDLIDINLLSLSKYFTLIYILALIAILGVGFMILAKRSTGEIRSRSINYSIGLVLFGVCGAIDSEISLGLWMVLIRILMVVAYLFLYKAMVPPKASFPPSKSK